MHSHTHTPPRAHTHSQTTTHAHNTKHTTTHAHTNTPNQHTHHHTRTPKNTYVYSGIRATATSATFHVFVALFDGSLDGSTVAQFTLPVDLEDSQLQSLNCASSRLELQQHNVSCVAWFPGHQYLLQQVIKLWQWEWAISWVSSLQCHVIMTTFQLTVTTLNLLCMAQ